MAKLQQCFSKKRFVLNQPPKYAMFTQYTFHMYSDGYCMLEYT